MRGSHLTAASGQIESLAAPFRNIEDEPARAIRVPLAGDHLDTAIVVEVGVVTVSVEQVDLVFGMRSGQNPILGEMIGRPLPPQLSLREFVLVLFRIRLLLMGNKQDDLVIVLRGDYAAGDSVHTGIAPKRSQLVTRVRLADRYPIKGYRHPQPFRPLDNSSGRFDLVTLYLTRLREVLHGNTASEPERSKTIKEVAERSLDRVPVAASDDDVVRNPFHGRGLVPTLVVLTLRYMVHHHHHLVAPFVCQLLTSSIVSVHFLLNQRPHACAPALPPDRPSFPNRVSFAGRPRDSGSTSMVLAL